jgi:DNA-binding Lrp family transcriptional regulator
MDPLLKLLEEHALRTPVDLSKMLNLPADEVQRRIKQYEDDKIILGYKAVINDDKVDTDLVKAVIEVKIQPEREGGFDRVAKRIARFDEVTSLFLMSGGYDLLIFVEGHSLRQVAQFVAEKLATLDGVTSTGTHFMLKTYKEQGVMMDGPEEYERLKISPYEAGFCRRACAEYSAVGDPRFLRHRPVHGQCRVARHW